MERILLQGRCDFTGRLCSALGLFRPALHKESGRMFNPNQTFLLVQKLKSASRVLHQESRLNQKKSFQSAPRLLIHAELNGLVLAPRLKKGYHQIWEANLQPLGPMFQHLFINILTSMFQHLLATWGQTASQKCSKLAPSFFGPDSQCKVGLSSLSKTTNKILICIKLCGPHFRVQYLGFYVLGFGLIVLLVLLAARSTKFAAIT